MSQFGTTTILGSTFTLNRGGPQWSARYRPTTSGHVYQVTQYIQGQVGTNANLTIDIYADDGTTTQPGVLLATSANFLVTTSLAAQWVSMPISLNVTTNTAYWLCPRCQNAGASGITIFAAVIGVGRVGTFTQQSNPCSGWSLVADPFGVSIYADYVEVEGDNPPVGVIGRGAGW